ncbi:hypothetical protein [Phosphitispora fastidiosa]|uniref:hypothetical protein n=1 Tax=Phosphitispora fastidiosa TaxID=2837202 RepID=UPI001E5F6F6B|nr:hypothetical protein [Phosphitispora fastidiosa]MBU7006299.1 hypothetical protein [Phosphitispora fastidiosa]
MITSNTPAWPVIDFSGGMNDFVEDGLVAANECTDVQNCICITPGRLQKRKGQTKLNSSALAAAIQGLHAFYYGGPINRKLIAAANGKVYYWDSGTSAFVQIKTGLSTTNPIMFETCVNYMVGFDGANAPFKYDGTNPVSALANAPVGQCPVLQHEKLFVITDPDTIRWSDSFAPETWPGVNEKKFDQGDGDSLTMLARYGQQVLCCKKRRIFNLMGTSLDDFRSSCPEQNYGVVGPRAGFVMEPYFYYISYQGPMFFDTLQSRNIIETKLPRTWANVNQQYLEKSVAYYNPYYNILCFAVPEGASTVPNLVLAYDVKLQGWWIFRGITPSCAIEFDSGTGEELYTGHNASGFIVKQNTGYNDIGSAIEAYWVGPNFDDKDPVRVKNFMDVFATDVSGLNTAVFKYRLNLGSWITPTVKTDIDAVRRYRLIGAKGRQYQPRFEHGTIDKDFCLSGLKSYYDKGLVK